MNADGGCEMRLKALIATCVATVAAVAALTGCSSSEPYTPSSMIAGDETAGVVSGGV